MEQGQASISNEFNPKRAIEPQRSQTDALSRW